MASTVPLPDWPFAPGAGPFRVKGGSYRGHREFIDANVPGGFEGIVARLEPELQRFHTQHFLTGAWYDLAPLVAMAPVCGAALGITPDQYIRKRSRMQVDRDVRGVYGFLVKLATARMLATRVPRLINLYFDFSSTTTRVVEDDRVVTVHSGLPRPFAPWLVAVYGSYCERVLEVAGAGAHRVEAGPLRHEGESHGVETVGFDLEVVLGRR